MKLKEMFFLITLVLLVFAGCVKNDNQLQLRDESLSLKSASLNDKYIVVLNDDAGISKADIQIRNGKVKVKAYGLLKKYEITGEIEEVYETALQGFTVKMAPGQAKKLILDGDVKNVEADKIIALSPIEMNGKPGGGGTVQPTQIIPYGIGRVVGPIPLTPTSIITPITYTGNSVAWIIDTGIDLTHPDLNVDKTRGKSFVSRVTSPNDDNGHGSHVAGIIGAIDNLIGVVGVAAGATVIPVKVLDRYGSGTTSVVISGVNFVASYGQNGDVANMSLGGGISPTLDAAVLKASGYPGYTKNIRFVLAAGNDANDAINLSPARQNGQNIYTISAMDQLDNWASWSNYGSPVDYCAPGVSVISTYKNGGYAKLAGTSMAAPHVAGLLLLGDIVSGGNVIGDPDGNPDIIAHH